MASKVAKFLKLLAQKFHLSQAHVISRTVGYFPKNFPLCILVKPLNQNGKFVDKKETDIEYIYICEDDIQRK